MKRRNRNTANKPHLPGLTFTLAVGIMAISLPMLTTSCGKAKHPDSKDYNLVIITLDTMRADRIGAYGYANAQTPNLDRLAVNGVMFENCYTAVPVTLPAHCSIFTGRYPLGHQVRTNGSFFLDQSEITLAEKMKEQGFRTFAVIATYVLLSKFGLNQGFDFYDDSLNIDQLITNFDSEIKADQVYARFSKWFKKFPEEENRKEKFFAWIHFYDPHTPYDPPEEYRKRFGSHLEGLYDGEVAFMDVYVGKIIADLESANLLDHTLIIIVGDHGEAFGEHKEFGHSLFCYQENLRVPLVFYNPHLFPGGLTVRSRVNVVDIMPTVLELYGQEIPGRLHGKSFAGLLSGDEEKNQRTFYIESMHGKEEMGWAPLTAIIKDQYKYISLPEPELYDLSRDSKETDNLFRKKNVLAKTLDKTLMNLVKTYSSPGSDASRRRELTAADKKHLQSLGYISAFSNKTDVNLDPKKGILLENRFNEIEKEIDADQLDLAESHLQEMAEKNPKHLLPQYFGQLNTIYNKRNDLTGVIANWKKAIETFPQNDHFKINLAFEYYHLNRLEESEKLAVEILKNNDKYTRAYILRGRIEEKRNRIPEALAYFEKALTLEPHNVSLEIGYARLLGQNRDFPGAGEICDKLLADEAVTADPETKAKIGIVLTEIHKNEPALRLLSEAAAADPGNASAETWNYLGILYYRKQDFSRSLEAYRKSLEKDPRIAKTYNNLGTLYLSMFLLRKDTRMRDQAIAAFDKALALDPGLAAALNGRGSAYKFANRIRDALADWQKTLALKPDFIDAYFNLGVTYLQLNRREDALKYLNICKQKFYHTLSPRDRQQLDLLVSRAEGH